MVSLRTPSLGMRTCLSLRRRGMKTTIDAIMLGQKIASTRLSALSFSISQSWLTAYAMDRLWVMKGPIELAATVTGGRTDQVEITKHKEQQHYSALSDVPVQIIIKQSFKEVDATSRATITAVAVINATAAALDAQACTCTLKGLGLPCWPFSIFIPTGRPLPSRLESCVWCVCLSCLLSRACESGVVL